MRQAFDTTWKKTLLWTLLLSAAALAFAAVAQAAGPDEEEHNVRVIRRIGDCPEVRLLGSGGSGVHLLSASKRGFLGVEATSLTPELREHFGVPDDAGVLLSRVVEDSAAATAGLQVGDILTRIDGDEIASAGGLGRAIRRHEGGTAVEIEYWRDGQRYTATATLEERERCAFDIGEYLHGIEIPDLPRLEDLDIEIDQEAIREAMEHVHEALRSQDWQKHLEGLRAIDLEAFEERMEELQERLEELEKRLEQEHGRLERTERDRERERERAEQELERTERERERAERERSGGESLRI